MRGLALRVLALLAVAALIWTAGLLAFAGRIERSTPAPEPDKADGVVALTGHSDERIAAALRLLQQGKAQRLLISGVAPHVTRDQLQTLTGAGKPTFDCCVDLGFTAENTAGNAVETAQWARAKGYTTLILVTADYHMPRARLELRAAMPEARIIPYPVATGELDAPRWWKTQLGAQRMILEYCKYIVVLARETAHGLSGKPAPAGAAAAPAH
jgi:uncharacterized SAM-binding protein YcdF (DUF218 family)